MKKNQITQKRYTIAGGNLTALVNQQPNQNNYLVAKGLLDQVEQVGFIS